MSATAALPSQLDRIEATLGRLAAQVEALRGGAAAPQPFYTPKTLAARLSLDARTVRQLLIDRKIASYKVGGARRIAAEDVDAFLERNRTDAR